MLDLKRLVSRLPIHFIRYLLLSLTLISCASVGLNQVDLDELYGQVFIPERTVPAHSSSGKHYLQEIEPLLEKRCVACHGCYDAPCQLKLSSPEGISRGASKEQVYDGTRLISADPTRLNVDARSTEEWRAQSFHSILNERSQTFDTNLDNSLLFQMLKLKQDHPNETSPLLSDDFSLGLDREQQCPSPSEFATYAQENPKWGMPYGLPAISNKEHQLLKDWIAKGAPMAKRAIPAEIQKQRESWEAFLNGESLKHQLTGRYIYEHLFLGHIYFSDTAKNKSSEKPEHYFQLVRSSTPPGLPIRVIPTRRPYHAPGVSKVYYRLKQINGVIPSKLFMPYAFNQARMDWINKLFIKPEYKVEQLPGYDEADTINPLLTFKDLPVGSRYRFMLEEAEFIIKGFIKGPVCRGQIALNVIDDHFWVSFIAPEYQSSNMLNEFLISQSENLRLPGESSQKTQNIVEWLLFSSAHERFLEAKNKVIRERFDEGKSIDLDLIWNGGDDYNPNAALTIFRHFDSATVIQGHVGQRPKTAWLIGYPLLERIHYLLVAQFDVYGNITHQLLTRLYMDFLRMEGEFNFLAFLPQAERIKLAEHWYRGADDNVRNHLLAREKQILQTPNINYTSDSPKNELLDMITQRLGKSAARQYQLDTRNRQHQILGKLNEVSGRPATIMPEASIIYVSDNNHQSEAFTLIRNSGHTNISSLLYEDKNRLSQEDYLTLIPGIVANYPGAFFKLSTHQLEDFVTQTKKLTNEANYHTLKSEYGIRRTHPDFWEFSDQVHAWFERNDPLNAGMLDYNRLENR